MASTKPTSSFPSTQTQQPTPPTSRPASQAPPSRPASQALPSRPASSQAPPTRPASQAGPTGLRCPSNRKSIYDRNLNRTRTAELSRASFAYLFAEMVSYAQKRVTGIQDLERRYPRGRAGGGGGGGGRSSSTALPPSPPPPPPPPNRAPRASSPSCNSSPARSGCISSRAPPTPSRRALRTPRST